VCCIGRLDARQKLDQIVLSVSNKCQLLENAELTAVRCVMLDEHARFCFFVDAMKPLMVRSVALRPHSTTPTRPTRPLQTDAEDILPDAALVCLAH